jgi:hypothetical protein
LKPFNPRSTTVENIVYDKIMPNLSANGWKILCLAIRKTLGWADTNTQSGRKESDIISISQFMEGCGIGSNNTVIQAIDECMSKGYLLREPAPGRTFSYRLNLDYEIGDAESAQPEQISCAENAQPNDADSAYTNNNVNNKKRAQTSKEKILEGNRLAYEKSLQRQASGEVDLSWLPEGLVHFAKVFLQAWNPDYMPSKRDYSYWRSELREWQRIGMTDDIIIQSISTSRRNGMPISSPRSLTKTAIDIISKGTQGQGEFPPEFHSSEAQVKSYKKQFGI